MDSWAPKQRSRLPADHVILKRRQSEDARAQLQSGIKQVEHHTGLADWETKSTAVMARRRVQAGVARRQHEAEQDLLRRRQLLAALLQQERELFEEEFQNSFETPEQRRERMKARATELKDARETTRREVARKCLEQRDRMAQDEMRLQQSKMRTVKVASDRKLQLEEKAQLAEERRLADEEHAREWLASIAEKKAREERERAALRQRNDEMKGVLDNQVGELAERKRLQASELEHRRAGWRDEWAQQEEDAKARARQLEEEQRLTRQAVQQENADRAAKRSEGAQAERQMDKYLLRLQMDQDKKAEADRVAKQEALQRAQREFQAHLRELAVREARDESDLERIRLEEQEKEWRKREARWQGEEEQRRRLMRDVDAGRQEQIAERQRRAAEELAAEKVYVQRKSAAEARADEEYAEQQREEFGRRKLNQQLLQEQKKDKERLHAIERQRELLIDKRAARYTEQFDKKIADLRQEASDNTDMLENFPRRAFPWT